MSEGSGVLREVGHFRELAVGVPDGPSLYDAMQPTAHPDEALLVSYLRGGSVLATTGKAVDDVVSGAPAVAALALCTDGQWLWPADLAHYVERYHVRLPDELVAHALAAGGVAQQLAEDELIALTNRLFAEEQEPRGEG